MECCFHLLTGFMHRKLCRRQGPRILDRRRSNNFKVGIFLAVIMVLAVVVAMTKVTGSQMWKCGLLSLQSERRADKALWRNVGNRLSQNATLRIDYC